MIKKLSFSMFIVLFILTFNEPAIAKESSIEEWLEEDSNADKDKELVGNDQDIQVSEISTGTLIWDIVKMVFALLLILALIYILIRFLNKRNKLFQQVKTLENLGGISLGQNKSIQIVRIGSKIYMIGVGESVELLDEIVDKKMKEDLLHKEEVQQFQAADFILSLFKRKANKDEQEDTSKDTFNTLFTKELKNLKQSRQDFIEKHRLKEDQDE